MSKDILFSICIPSYNRPKELKRLLESIDFSNKDKMEILIAEDHSPKRREIGNVVREFKSKSEHTVRYIENDVNLGYDGNLRNLIDLAEGEFVLFMGDDDVFIPNKLDNYATFLEQNIDCGYILRSYRNVYNDGTSEDFKYFSENKRFQASKDTYIALFDKSVFISGFTIRKVWAKEFETKEFDGSLLYQLYLLAEVTRKYPSAYYHDLLTQAFEGGVPFFGSSEAEKDLYTPGTVTIQNSLNFMGWYMKIIDYIAKKYNDDSADRIRLNMSKYSYPVLSIQRGKGRKQFKKYALELKKLGLGKSFYFDVYFYSLYIFGTSFNDKGIRLLKKIIGHRPKL